MLAGLVAAVVILALIAIEKLGGGPANDALLMKNLTFYFGTAAAWSHLESAIDTGSQSEQE